MSKTIITSIVIIATTIESMQAEPKKYQNLDGEKYKSSKNTNPTVKINEKQPVVEKLH